MDTVDIKDVVRRLGESQKVGVVEATKVVHSETNGPKHSYCNLLRVSLRKALQKMKAERSTFIIYP